MRIVVRSLAALVLAGVMLSGWGILAQSGAGAADHTVTIFDTSTPEYRPITAETGTWGFAPFHTDVIQGEKINFVNPASNAAAHGVTSLTFTQINGEWEGITAGTQFDSSPTRDTRLKPGTSFTVDTTGFEPGQYTYYCPAHWWMVGTFTVLAPA